MAEAKKTPEATPEAAANDSVVVVDLGKKYKRKHIRRLRKGRGKLMGKVQGLVADLRDDMPNNNVQPVVVVVRQKKKKNKFW